MGKKKDKQIIVRLICIVLSFALWLYVTNVENPTRTSTLKNVPVTIENEESLNSSNLALSSDQDLTVDLKLEGSANDIYSVKRDEFKLKVDLSQYALKKGENNIPVEVINYPDDINIKNGSVISIKIITEEVVEKEFNIESDVSTNFTTGHSAYSELISPNKVTVTGAESQVNKISRVVLTGEENNISESFTKKYKLKPLDSAGNEVSDVELNIKTAELSVNVAVSKEVELRVRHNNVKDGVTIDSIIPSKKTVTIIGSKDVIDNIEYLETEEIDISNINSDYKTEAKIICPEGVKISGEENIFVQFKITDNQLITQTFSGIKISYKDKNEDEYSYELPDSVDITIQGTKEQIDQITEENILIEASLKDLKEGSYQVTWNASLINVNNDCKITNDNGKITVVIKSK